MGAAFPLFRAAFFHKRPELAKTIWCQKCFRHHLVVSGSSSSSLAAPKLPSEGGSSIPLPPTNLHAAESDASSLLALDPGTLDSLHCPEFPVSPSDLEIWELNWNRLARTLCATLELHPRFAPLSLFNTCQIGAWSADAIPVILTLQPDRDSLRFVVSELLARLRQQFILLTATNKNLDAKIHELLASVGAAIFPLETTVTFTENGSLRPRRRPGELFARFTPQPKLPEDAALRAFAIIKSLDDNPNTRHAPVLTVFRLYCIDNLSVQQIAKKLRCSKATVINRLRTIHQKTGADPKTLRAYSSQFTQIEDSLSDSRARRIARRTAIGEAKDEEPE
jgi:predicted DNA-binding protein YlxM (UPF0122 family)